MRESMSNLEKTLLDAVGINIVLRHKLINAYRGSNGAAEVPALIEEFPHLISSPLLPKLRKLAQDENYAGE